MTGKILDERYELIEKIGSGGMADVYKAKDILLDRIVAVKICTAALQKTMILSCGSAMKPSLQGSFPIQILWVFTM